jgi:hypothetical protein
VREALMTQNGVIGWDRSNGGCQFVDVEYCMIDYGSLGLCE